MKRFAFTILGAMCALALLSCIIPAPACAGEAYGRVYASDLTAAGSTNLTYEFSRWERPTVGRIEFASVLPATAQLEVKAIYGDDIGETISLGVVTNASGAGVLVLDPPRYFEGGDKLWFTANGTNSAPTNIYARIHCVIRDARPAQ
jgi:hypothetical protein